MVGFLGSDPGCQIGFAVTLIYGRQRKSVHMNCRVLLNAALIPPERAYLSGFLTPLGGMAKIAGPQWRVKK